MLIKKFYAFGGNVTLRGISIYVDAPATEVELTYEPICCGGDRVTTKKKEVSAPRKKCQFSAWDSLGVVLRV